ncbi:heterotrimeric G-protein alpha subunit, GPA3-like protein [Mycena metata]|uniref:Heterotrimeric G-protein alpha subunit, GPA3-like protein n=1 Tax=Mycena metata TaxID=1033252 RepID=A0AAD7ME85_9AGAR|nr:heterotrimeric G-protein alpha subunit, GPA3-like protein [Mycena metata]
MECFPDAFPWLPCNAAAARAARALAQSEAIDLELVEDNKKLRRDIKILLLGSGDSGKSTIVKQMKIMHHDGFDERERAAYRTTIYNNVLDSARTLARIVRRIGISALPEEKHRSGSRGTMPLGLFSKWEAQAPTPVADAQAYTILTPKLADAIWNVWRVPAVEQVVNEHPVEFHLMDNAGYFFSDLGRIVGRTYLPTVMDILFARAKSTGIMEARFSLGGLSIHMFDVGGQRSERKKWIHCFESVTSIIFCTALSEYNQVLEEVQKINRMQESLYLFESVINSRWFLRTSIILFLNKIDIFKQKLLNIPLGHYFPEYSGGDDINKGAKFVLLKFMENNRLRLPVYPHLTQATNTANMRLVFAAVKETILQNALKDSGIL